MNPKLTWSLRRVWPGLIGLLALTIGIMLGLAPGRSSEPPPHARLVNRLPMLRPDYSDTVIPPNIAPLNFRVAEPGRAFWVEVRGERGMSIRIGSRASTVEIPAAPWRALLTTNAGSRIYFDVFAREPGGAWDRFLSVTNRVALEPIDGTLVYRLLGPLYNYYNDIGIYQRDLEGYRQKLIVDSSDIGHHCLNCHTFLNGRPDTFAFHVRGVAGPQPMILVQSNQVSRVDNTAGYFSWHPSGRLIAYSANKLSFFVHTTGEARDVFDADSDLKIYRVDANRVETPPVIGQPDWNETWPAWGPTGRHLYFCRARKQTLRDFRKVRYDLARVSYDLARDAWGKVETLVAAADSGLSASEPVVSPDGRWLLFCLAPYGNFPIYQPKADLYVMDLRTRHWRRLSINSDQADTWHSWSRNGRWVVFSSKRDNGLLARPYFTYVDEQGTFYKPFLLPQRDPAYYDAYLKTFNRPELVTGPVAVSRAALARAVLRPERVRRPASSVAEDQTPAAPHYSTAQ
ncbi:MAG: PD40 domain-containing protein [Verrucomicrobia bacterium]|nr:PD40 domain-containing protein [Verrucomicrobiota bacterium]